MPKTGLRIAAAFSLVAGVAAIPVSVHLLPYARRANTVTGTDGREYLVSVDAGAWVLKLGIAAAIVFVVLALVFLWLARRRRPQD
jgi:hypothetical protein